MFRTFTITGQPPVRVHRIPMGMAPGYLVETDGGLLLIDAGSVRQEGQVVRAMQELGRDDLRLIFITHAHLDHYGSAAALRRITGAPIAVHHLDSDPLAQGRTPIGSAQHWQGATLLMLQQTLGPLLRPPAIRADLLLEDGDVLPWPGCRAWIVHTPGHTLGSASLLLEDGIAFVGDLLSNTGRPHAQRWLAQDWSAVPKSVRRVQTLEPELTFVGHGHRPLSRSELLELHPATD